MPEVEAIDVAVGEPQGAVVGVIGCLVRSRVHGEAARHRHTAGPQHGVDVGALGAGEVDLGHELALQLHGDGVLVELQRSTDLRVLRHLEGVSGRPAGSEHGQGRANE